MGATDTGATDGAVKNMQSKSKSTSGVSGSVGFNGANPLTDVRKVSSALPSNGFMNAPNTGDIKAPSTGDKAPSNQSVTSAKAGTKKEGTVDGGLADPTIPKPPTSRTAGDILREKRTEKAEAAKQARAQQRERDRQAKAREAEQAQANKLAQANQASPLPRGESQGESLGDGLPKPVDDFAKLVKQKAAARHAREAAQRTPLSAEDAAELQRTADGVGKYKGVGDPESSSGQASRASPRTLLTVTATRQSTRSHT